MSEYKVSIIIPAYNAEKYLAQALDSVASQSIGVENLEVIIVNDASSDGTGQIIDEYCRRYPSFRAIHLDENMGAAWGPRNIALKKASSDYIMFLDADDTYTQDACEALYNEITSSDANMVFGRYYRVFSDYKLKSYSSYGDDFEMKNDLEYNPNFSGAVSFLWSRIFYRIFYGSSGKVRDRIFISDVRQNPEILKVLPSIWTKIFKKSILGEFPHFIAGEDLNFVLDAYSKGNIVFLNDRFITNYYIRFDDEELSVTKNINFNLVLDSIRAYKLAIQKCNEYGFVKYDKMINPFLLNYLSLMKKGDFSKSEMKILQDEINEIDDIYKNKGLLGFLIVRFIKFSSR